MQEQVIRSKSNILWPWIAVSVAIHGLLLVWYVDGDTPSTAGGEHVVEISISAKQPRIQTAKPLKEKRIEPKHLDQSAEAERLQSSEKADEQTADKTADQTAEVAASEMSAQTNSSADDSKQESLVRHHLEQFKFYPMSARRRGIVGEVEVAFELNARGQANMLKILTASGYRVLDEAALEAVRRAVPFPVERGAFHFKLLFRTSS